jgi:hypothetical protein
VVDHQHVATALTGGDRAHQPGGTGADDQYVGFQKLTVATPLCFCPSSRLSPE